jgi:Holliday junction resolvasome RuvABC endonuclease subunit
MLQASADEEMAPHRRARVLIEETTGDNLDYLPSLEQAKHDLTAVLNEHPSDAAAIELMKLQKNKQSILDERL